MLGEMVLKKDGWKYFLDKKEVTEEEYHKVYPPAPKAKPGEVCAAQGTRTWPMVSKRALRVSKNQVKEANARNAAHGVKARYDDEGNCHIPDAADRKKLLKLEGMYDHDGYY